MSPLRQRPERRHQRGLGFLRLYLDDLDVLHQYLVAHTKEVEISVGNRVADEINDLATANSRLLRDIGFKTETPSIAITLSRSGAKAQTWDADEDGRSLIDDVARLLKDEASALVALRFLWFKVVEVLVGLILLVSSVVLVVRGELFFALMAGSVCVVALLDPALLGSDRYGEGGVIFTAERRDEVRRSKRQRRRELVFALVGTTVGAIVGGIVVYLLTKAAGSP